MNRTQAMLGIHQVGTLPVNAHGLTGKTHRTLVLNLNLAAQPNIPLPELGKD
ncbi:MAG: hypothetical protein VW447_05910 [Limnobacter sp.]